ncbi:MULTISPECIES: maleylpyruvate isomerase family mycothiol-dependent enzyme [Actinomadura]|uniref:Maleylpyruvate isomerase family mycothiol-dependent enzyme n=1 Tax=Actinomadura miaoliensis TaxID=430685 RepID=A0ABP7WNX0_9ACTN
MERPPNHVVYALVRRNVRALVDGRPDAAGAVVPACPEWRVRDLVAHLLDICEQAVELVTGRASGPVRTDTPRADGPTLTELLDRWEERGAELDALVARTGDPRSAMLTHDAFCHELDLRVAVGAPPPAGHPGYTSLLHVPVGGFLERVRELGLPALRVETPGDRWATGPDEAAGVLSAGRHDLYRSLTGRRTHDQIAALSWSGDPERWLPAFTRGPFRPPERPAEELAARY